MLWRRTSLSSKASGGALLIPLSVSNAQPLPVSSQKRSLLISAWVDRTGSWVMTLENSKWSSADMAETYSREEL